MNAVITVHADVLVPKDDRLSASYDDVIKWKPLLRYWPFLRGIHRSPVNSPNKGQWRGALMFSLICAWINDWINNWEAGDLKRHHAHYDVIVMQNDDYTFGHASSTVPQAITDLKWNFINQMTLCKVDDDIYSDITAI